MSYTKLRYFAGKRYAVAALLSALAVTLALIAGSVYLVNVLWPSLPSWLMVILFVLLAVMVIGLPIYSLARWSDRRWRHQLESGRKRTYKRDVYAERDD